MNYQREALKAARDLCYGKDVERAIRNAKSETEIIRIMITARNAEIKERR